MADLTEAYRIASEYFEKNGHLEVTSFFSAAEDGLWIAYGGRKDRPRTGSFAVSISRKSGELKPFPFPTRENFEIMQRAEKVEEKLYLNAGEDAQEENRMREEKAMSEKETSQTGVVSQTAKEKEERTNAADTGAAENPSEPEEKTENSGNGQTALKLGDQLTLQQILEAVEKLDQAFDQKVKVDKGKDEMIKTLKDEVAAYQKGNMTKVIDTMSLDIIQLADGIRKTAAVYEKREYSEENYKKLLRVVKGMYQDLQDVLYREGIEPYSIEGHEVDARRQTIIASVPTDDEKKNNLIAARAGEGYAREDGSVLRRERVKIFRYEKKEDQ